MTTEVINVEFLIKNPQELKFLEGVNSTFERADKAMQGLTARTNKFASAMNSTNTNIIKFNGNLLSLLFMGMELQKVFGGALKSIFEGYKQIMPESDEFNRLTTQLSANWEFFKFQLADTLAKSELFQFLIQSAITLLGWFSQLPAPLKSMVAWGLILGAIFGTLAFLIGFWGLALASVFNLLTGIALYFGLISISANNGAIAITAAGTATLAWLTTVLLVAGAFIILATLWKKFVDANADDLGILTDNWYDYVSIFVMAFINGVAQISLAILSLPAYMADALVTMGKLLLQFTDFAKDAFMSIFTKKTLSEAFDEWMSDSANIIMKAQNGGFFTNLIDELQTGINNTTLEATRELTGASDSQQTLSNNNVITNQPVIVMPTLDDLVTQGYLTQDQLNQIKDVSNNGQ